MCMLLFTVLHCCLPSFIIQYDNISFSVLVLYKKDFHSTHKPCFSIVNYMTYVSVKEHSVEGDVVCCFRWEWPPGALHIRLGSNASVCVPPQALPVGSKFILFLHLPSFHLLYSPSVSLHMTPSHPAAHFAPPTFINDLANPSLNSSASAPAPLLTHTSPHKSNLPFQTCALMSLFCTHCLY